MAIHIVLDCANPERLAEFWSQALGYSVRGFAEQWGMLQGERPEDVFLLQRVDEPKVGKNRMHVDVVAEDIEAKAAELEAIGGKRLTPEPLHQFKAEWIVMADPEGNEFCVCKG